MSLKRLSVFLAIGLLTVAANAAQIIVPAAGTGAGAQNSHWQSDVMLHNAAPRPIEFTASLHLGTEVIGPRAITLAARNTSKLTDVVRSTFGVQAGTGALVFELVDRDLKYLAVTSRTYNTIGGIEYGQDVPAVPAAGAATAGEIAVLTNPGSVADRFNFGLYAVEAAEVTWELVRADGTIDATEEATYAAGQHVQYNNGLSTLLAASAQPGDSVYARIMRGKAIVYGSAINASGDPTFVGSNITRDDVVINLGIDVDENGTIDIRDENKDGVLDTPITVYTSMFPAYVRVVATSEFGEPVTLEVVESEAEAVFRDNNGTMRIGAAGDLKNKTGRIVLRATSNGTVTIFTVPVTFR
jgi:hypothetical protein